MAFHLLTGAMEASAGSHVLPKLVGDGLADSRVTGGMHRLGLDWKG